jgi:regulator of protease activity HflC (stomatin/prohibitin superfamily)
MYKNSIMRKYKSVIGYIALIVLGIPAFILLLNSFTVVEAGEAKVGILLGKPTSTYNEGFHVKNPFEGTVTYKVRRNSKNYEGEVLTSDQVSLNLTVNVPYRLQ